MNIGAVYPQTEIDADPTTVRRFVAGVEALGFSHILVYDHVLGADPAVHTDFKGAYDVDDTFHEPFVFFGFLAAITALELATGIVIAPQRQTALLAKQAAEVDILTQGRFRLGLGIGWNKLEYDALGEDFSTRGRREEEQIALLRRLWTERSVSFEGSFDRIDGAGLAPMPVQRPIPIWLGGQSEAACRRVGRLGDGWITPLAPGPELDAALSIVHASANAAGRDPIEIGLEGRTYLKPEAVEGLPALVERWDAYQAAYFSIVTMQCGLRSVDEHLELLERSARALGLSR